ncbi:MAG: ROK family protein [Desertimonas sp.]
MKVSSALAVGLDIGGSTTRAVAYAPDGAAVAAASDPTPRGVAAVADLAAALVAHLVGHTPPTLVALGVPGAVDHLAGTVAGALNLGIAARQPIAALVAARVGAPVHVENDVNAAALGAYAALGLGPASSLVYLNVGTGLAAGAVFDGQLWRGARGIAGEIGHVPRDPAGPVCACGQRGCAETLGSGRALGVGADEAAIARTAAWGLQLVALTWDPEVLVLGGGMTRRAGFIGAVHRAVRDGASTSPLLAATSIEDRLRPVPDDVGVGSLGALIAAGWRRPG